MRRGEAERVAVNAVDGGADRRLPPGSTLLDAVCLLGPMARCREQLAAFRDAGVGLPILVPPIGVEGARTVIKAFRR